MKFTGSDVTSAGAVTLTSSGSTVSVEGTKFAGDSIDQGAGSGALTVEGVALENGGISASGTIALTSANAQAITHTGTGSGNKDLSISSTNGAVNVEGAKFTGDSIDQGAGDGALTVEGVTLEDGDIGSAAIVATESITSSKSSGGLLLTSTDAQVITHTGTGSGNKDLSISSTNGAVNVEDMKFTGSDVTSAGAVTLTSSGSTVSV